MIDRLDIQALADDELETGQAKTLRAALKADPQAQAEYESILNFKQLVRRKAVAHNSEEGWKACQKRLNELDRSKSVEGFVGRYAWAMCGVFFLLILGSRFMVSNVRGSSEKVSDLGRIFALPHGSTAPSPDQRLYRSIFERVRGVIDTNRLPVQGQSVDTMHDFRVAHYRLVDDRGPMELFVIPAMVNFEDATQIPDEAGVSEGLIPAPGSMAGQAPCLIWHKDGMTIVLAGQRSSQDLDEVRFRISQN